MNRIKFKNTILEAYIQKNAKEVLSISITFIIGIIVGVFLINNIKNERKSRNSKLYK